MLWGSGWLLAYCRIWVLVFLSYNKGAFRAPYTGDQRPKAVLDGEHSPGSNWELEQEKCVISDVKVSDTRLPTNTLCHPPSWPAWNNSLLSAQTKGFLHLCKGGERAEVTCPGWIWRVLTAGLKRITPLFVSPVTLCLLLPGHRPNQAQEQRAPGLPGSFFRDQLVVSWGGQPDIKSSHWATFHSPGERGPGSRSNVHYLLLNLKTRLQNHMYVVIVFWEERITITVNNCWGLTVCQTPCSLFH